MCVWTMTLTVLPYPKPGDDEFTQYPLVMGLILGTGVGGGLVLNGKPITGQSYITGEFGHIRLPVDALTLMGF
ncbi:ROK family protein [Salmonella enterica subsp. arizonae]|uniref:ROK family protein n=1 Tax=Salmonella enterica subsp. arizonae TaxID=59203 RepID=A0A379TDH1_SALER|nr:ROK family protein [Salmonella enterica subsp. arizonae]